MTTEKMPRSGQSNTESLTTETKQTTPKNFLDKTFRTRWYPSFTSYLETAPFWNEDKMQFLQYEREICPKTGKLHWQGVVYFYNKVSFKTAQKLLKIGNAHIENIPKSGNRFDAIKYTNKDQSTTTVYTFGEPPQQGKRCDLIELKDEIFNGTKKVTDIIEENPIMYHMYGRTLEKIEDLKLQKTWRKEMTQGIWYYGKTGTGKSTTAYENYHPDTCYNRPKDSHWWDNYKQQPTVIINEFRGDIPFDILLELVDKHPMDVPRRGRCPMPFTSKLVIITSACHPEQIYKRNLLEQDKMDQFYRRFKIIELT